jgi:uncharacterized glyoxalase superfamily protein PhnB
MPSTVIPYLTYEDAPAMIEWLCDNFGFARREISASEDGTVYHAELELGENGMIMLGSPQQHSEFGRSISTPDKLGGTTQSPYIIVADVDGVYEKAKRSGADIVREIRTENYGGRGFTCLDPEGHLWSVGSYDPWAR